MPIYEYKCESCGKKLEVLQTSLEPYKSCSQVCDCNQNGVITKLVSSFAFMGDSSSADNFMNKQHDSANSEHSCSCFGTSSCPEANYIRSKYGLD